MADTNNKPILSRPKDRSLEAFKAWIDEITDHVAPDAPDNMTDDKWIAAHKKFWEKVDSAGGA